MVIANKKFEMYIETIWDITKGSGKAKVKDISNKMDVVPSSVTEMILKLKKRGYINHAYYKGCSLTRKGKETAIKLLKKEHLLYSFFHDVLKIPKRYAHSQACEIEHHIKDKTIDSLCKFLGHPEKFTMDQEHNTRFTRSK